MSPSAAVVCLGTGEHSTVTEVQSCPEAQQGPSSAGAAGGCFLHMLLPSRCAQQAEHRLWLVVGIRRSCSPSSGLLVVLLVCEFSP